MGMSPEEREDAIKGLMDVVGDDPIKRAEMELLISKLPALDAEQLRNSPGGIHSSMEQMLRDDELAKARRDAQQMMGGVSWDFFVENQAMILEATIAGGQISSKDAAKFQADEQAWMKQLRVIYEDVVKNTEL